MGRWLSAGLVVLVGWVLLFLDFYQLDQGLVFASYNLPHRWRGVVRCPEVVIVDMDEGSHDRLNQPRFGQWDRGQHAQLLEALAKAGAGPVVFDLLFAPAGVNRPGSAASDPRLGDKAFATALRAYPTNVVLASSLVLTRKPGEAEGGEAGSTLTAVLPQAEFLEAASRDNHRGTAHGFTEVLPDRDGVVREFWPVAEADVLGAGRMMPQLSLSVLLATRPAAAQRWLEEYRTFGRNRWLNYYGPPGTSFFHVPYHEALTPERRELFRGRYVMVGASPHLGFTGAGKDTFFHPYDRDGLISGIEVHATMLANLLRDDWLTRLPTLIELGVLTLTGAVLGLGLPRLRTRWASLAAVLAGGAVTCLAVASMEWSRVWFPWLIVVAAQIPAALLLALGMRSLRTHVVAERLRYSIGVYASDRLATEIMRNSNLLRLGNQPCELSVLFCDLVSFCRIGELLGPKGYRELLQQYYDLALDCVFKQDGMVLNIIGDCIFAAWNTPLSPRADHEKLACETAVSLQRRLAAFNRGRTGPELTARIGLHCGLVNVGNFGTPSRMVYTAIGDAVNLASRLEGLNRHLGTRTLASHAVHQSTEGVLSSRRVGSFRFQGFERSLEVVELLTTPPNDPPRAEWLAAFGEGLRHFRARGFVEAEAAFLLARQFCPQDGVAQFYLEEAIPHARTSPTKDDESGVVVVPGK